MTKTKLFPILLLIVFFSMCKKNKTDGPDDKEVYTKTCRTLVQEGLTIKVDGDISSQINPQNTQAFLDYSNCIAGCSDTDTDCMMGCLSILGIVPSGGAFSLTCYVTNITSVPIRFTLYPGCWFQTSSEDYQSMLCPVYIDVEIEGGQTTIIIIPVYCLDSGLSAPADDTDYTICELISSSDCLSDIIAILKTKDLSSVTYTQAIEIQKIIWNCTDSQSVNLEYLNNLPNL